MKHIIALAAACVLLAACQTVSPQSTIASLEVGLTTAETAATAYVQLPVCGGASKVCADPATVAKIKAADNTAYTDLKAAEAIAAAGGSPSLVAAQAAVLALQSLIPALGAHP